MCWQNISTPNVFSRFSILKSCESHLERFFLFSLSPRVNFVSALICSGEMDPNHTSHLGKVDFVSNKNLASSLKDHIRSYWTNFLVATTVGKKGWRKLCLGNATHIEQRRVLMPSRCLACTMMMWRPTRREKTSKMRFYFMLMATFFFSFLLDRVVFPS